MRDGCRLDGLCESWTEPETPEDMPCPSCWDAWRTGEFYYRDGQPWAVAHRIEGKLSSGVTIFCGWEPARRGG